MFCSIFSKYFDRGLTLFGKVLFFASIVLSIILSTENGFAYEQASCNHLKDEAGTLFRNMNSLFKVNQKVEFWTESPDGGPLTMDWAGNQVGGPIHIPDPCLMVDAQITTREAYLFMLAHEFSHGIIDQAIDKDCAEDYWEQFDDSFFETPEFHYLREMQHVNTDIFALKILSHFKIDQRKGVEGFESWMENHTISAELKAPHLLRTKHMSRHYGTSFHSGNDFTSAFLISNTDFLHSFLEREYPGSSMLSDLKSKYSLQKGSCLYSNPEERTRSLNAFRSLGVESNTLDTGGGLEQATGGSER